MKRTGLLLGVLALFACAAAPAMAQKVGNPSSSLSAVVDSGSLTAGTQGLHGTFVGPAQLFHGGTIAKDGAIDVPMANFAHLTFPVPDISKNAGVCSFSMTKISVTLIPTTDATGLLNPFTGQATLQVPFYVTGAYTVTGTCLGQAAGSYSPLSCQLGSADSPLQLQLTTTGGAPYNDGTGHFKVVDNTLSLPSSTGCDPVLLGFTLSNSFDTAVGLPAAAGKNKLIASGHLSPVIVRGVRAELTSAPQTGLAPLTVTLNASRSFAPAGVKSYAFSFGDGSAKAIGTAATRSHRYAKPGVYTATVTVTDTDGDANSARVPVTVKRSCIVPSVKGKQLSAARTALRGAGCTTGKITRRTSAKPSGVVIGQSLTPGTKAAFGAPVALVVSRGS